ncbi:DEAD/DEAH box helicase family protein [Empedobacter falsenii]
MTELLFPEPRKPKIYVYKDTHQDFKNYLKIGYTTKSALERIQEQYNIVRPLDTYEILLEEIALREDGTFFSDHDIHAYLKEMGFHRVKGEWFECTLNDVKTAITSIQKRQSFKAHRNQSFGMRPEQQNAVNKAYDYFTSFVEEDKIIPHFLWNAKMRFGKTFASYQLAKKMQWKKVLVLTFKPAVEDAWKEDLETHIDFENWQFISKNSSNTSINDIDVNKPFVAFGSFQDYLGKSKEGGIKSKNQWAHDVDWDCIIFDEYHFGAWRETAKELFESEDQKQQKENEVLDYFDESLMPLKTKHYLYLSGTPFRALATGEFIEEQIFNWTYSDEQKAKEEWEEEINPYASLPRIVMLTYQMPEDITAIAEKGEFNQFDLNSFFEAEGYGKDAVFVNEEYVQKWLDLIRGSHKPTSEENLKLGAQRPPMPFSDTRLLNSLQHTFWFLPSVASCYAMANLLAKPTNSFYHKYKTIVCTGTEAGIGLEALPPVKKAIGSGLGTQTITLSCGKLTTGVSIPQLSGIFMLRNMKSPETYFQAAFRVQTPWTVKNPDGKSPNTTEIVKNECYIFDFAPDRALKQIADYSISLNVEETDPEIKVKEFINYLPVLAYDGSYMKEIDAAGILDIAMSGTSATLLAKRWESALLVNVDNVTLQKLMQNQKAMDALMSIEGFRSLNQDIETINNKSEAVKEKKKESAERELTKAEKKEMTEDEKKEKSLRKQIQEKLIKFATRIPVFMYLTDYRERTLKDVITQLEPGLFKKVTGLTVADFELLVSLNVFNSILMNDAVYKFKRYEDASLSYTGIVKHDHEEIGLWNTTVSHEEYIKEQL